MARKKAAPKAASRPRGMKKASKPLDHDRDFKNGSYNVPVKLGAVSGNKMSATVTMSVPRSSFPAKEQEEMFVGAEHEATFKTDDELFDEGWSLPLKFVTTSLRKKPKTLEFSAKCMEKSNDLIQLFMARQSEGWLSGKVVALYEPKRGRPSASRGDC